MWGKIAVSDEGHQGVADAEDVGQSTSAIAGRRVLIFIENLPAPFDRRVWQEATTLKEAGYQVSTICPTGRGFEKRHEFIDGIAIYRHPLPLEADGAPGQLL